MSSITLISGPPAAGKSTLSAIVSRRSPKCILIPVDQLREMMVTGQMTPDNVDEDRGEFPRQFQWARSTAIYMAELYASNGVDVVIDDGCVPDMFADHYAPLVTNPSFRRILLMPRLDVQLDRIRQRGGPWDEVLVNRIPDIYEYLVPMSKEGWHVIDSSHMTIDQTVDEIVSHLAVDIHRHIDIQTDTML